MQVSKLWRYPTKSRGGEPLETAQLTADGNTGDRIVNVRGARSPLTGQTRQSLLTVPARLNGQLHHIAIGRTHTPEPASPCSSPTSTSASSTPPPARSSAVSPSTPPAATTAPANPRPTRKPRRPKS